MKLKRLNIVNFKNHELREFIFNKKISCFTGKNGVGKTNVLDAMYYLSFSKSFINPTDNQNIRNQEDFFTLRGVYEIDQMEENIVLTFSKTNGKTLKRNDKEYEKIKEDLYIEVDQAYWLVVSLINKQKLAQNYKELLTTLYNNVEKSIKEGVATKGDALNVKVKLNEANLALTKATNGIALAKMQLLYLAGLDVTGNYTVADSDIAIGGKSRFAPQESEVVNLALSNRLELKELSKLENISESQIIIARSRFLPNIVATGNYYMTNPNTFNGFSKSFKGAFALGVGITIPIFHFGDRIYTLNAAKNEHNIVLNRIEQARKLISLQSTMSKYKLDEAKSKLTTAISNIEAAKENLRLAELSYKEGLITLSDLLAAQTAYISAESEQIDAAIDVRICELTLKKNMGIGVGE